MPRRGKKRSSRQKNREVMTRSPIVSHYIEWRPSAIFPGSTVVFRAQNVEAPRDRSYRLNGVTVELVSDKPVVCQVRIYGPNDANESISNTGPFCVGFSPRTVSLRSPPGTDWFARALSATWPIAAVDCICLKKGETKADVCFVMKLDLSLSAEVIPEACPVALVVRDYEAPPS